MSYYSNDVARGFKPVALASTERKERVERRLLRIHKLAVKPTSMFRFITVAPFARSSRESSCVEESMKESTVGNDNAPKKKQEIFHS